ncbi:cell division protein FtsN [Avibacterium sp. 20-129]|uniref:cell division protein FtsN n=1 Tax=Avibacterium sp. 20-129 TaxID=2911525 RepID=UPI002247BF88|nr:cell division protein FtsN [Avibacterium sp. 20-129]MCW9699849.1 cell division protein FtsN [Avibacterium sp. 20-129]
MAQRDYARRTGKPKKKAKKVNKPLILGIAALVIGIFVAGLFLLKEKSNDIAPVLIMPEKNTPKSVLPTPPEEVWSYIKALETRTVPVDDNPKSLEKNMRLTEEQKKVLIEMEKEQKAAEAARLKQAEERKKAEELAAKEAARKPAPVKVEVSESKPTVVETTSVVKAKEDSKKVETPKKAETPKKVETAVAKNTDGERKYGLQCGAFKNRQQAENIQAKLVLAGFNARVNSSADWNRVVIGPVGDRTTTQKTLEKAKSITTCVLIGM